MSGVKVPSVQHLSRNWHHDPKVIQKRLVNLARRPPHFNYHPLYGAIRDLLLLGVPYEQVAEGIRRGVKRKDVRENLLGVLPFIRDHFEGVAPTFFQEVDRRFYAVARGLMVPFDPPMIFGVGGQIFFPWFSFWRQNPLAAERLSLFVTMVEEMLLQDPDLESATFQILDFSVPKGAAARVLQVIDAAEIPRVAEDRKRVMLETFAEGYEGAQAELAGAPKPVNTKPSEDDRKGTPDLFDGDRTDP